LEDFALFTNEIPSEHGRSPNDYGTLLLDHHDVRTVDHSALWQIDCTDVIGRYLAIDWSRTLFLAHCTFRFFAVQDNHCGEILDYKISKSSTTESTGTKFFYLFILAINLT
jgi:hypothetical protein